MPTNVVFDPAIASTAEGKNINLVYPTAVLSGRSLLKTYTNTSTWSMTGGCKQLKITVIGGGGGGGSIASSPSLASAGGGGGAGGCAIKYLDLYSYPDFVNLTSAQITIGLGGTESVGGGSSSILFNNGLVISATGGSAGLSPSKSAADFGLGGLGGIGSNGDLNLPGKVGENGRVSIMYTYSTSGNSRTFVTSAVLRTAMDGSYYLDTNTAVGLSSVSLSSALDYENASGGNGASSEYGAGGRGAKSSYNSTTDEIASVAASGYGAGGGGGSFTTSASSQSGSSGSNGIIIIEEFY